MPSVYQLKSAFQGLLRPLVTRLAARGVTANQVTLAAVALSLAEGLMMALMPAQSWPFLLLPLVLFLRMALNAIDGMLAREHSMQSKLGAVLNEIGDVVSDAALYLPFALVMGLTWWMVAGAVILAVISEMTGVVGVQIGASRRYDGPMGKSDRAVFFGALGLYIGLQFPQRAWLDLVLMLVNLLLCYTIYNRARRALEEVHG